MKKLLQVGSFGGIDADQDGLLDLCFQDHEAYLLAKDHARFIIVGRKGSGKTAIFRKLIDNDVHNTFTRGYAFTDYPWAHHDLQQSFGVPEEARYTHSWKYLILITASDLLLNLDQSQPWKPSVLDDLSKLEAFLVDSYGSKQPDVTRLFTPGSRLRINPSLGIPGTGATVGASLEQLPISDLPGHFQEVNRTIATSVMRVLNPEFNYHICFDQLDLGFDSDSRQYSDRLTGLILAARDLSHLAANCGKKFSVSVFLRDDIFQRLRFEDKNKIAENCMSRIEWDSERTQWTLKDLMEKRFGQALEIDSSGSWNVVFDESHEMPRRQTKYQHILDRTFRRPRDIIKFCNLVLSEYKRRGGSSSGKFENQDVANARPAYSDYLLNELDDEIFKHVSQYEEYLEVLKGLGTLQFSRADFEGSFSARVHHPANGAAPTDALKALFDFSVVSFLRVGGGSGGSQYVWRYLDSRAQFDETAETFRVHPGFKEVLGLKLGGSGEDD